MEKETRRGYVPEDEREFYQDASISLLKRAQEEVFWLLERGYPIKPASVFVGNHHLLSERQRLALVRATSPSVSVVRRAKKRVDRDEMLAGRTVRIDGFNLIITLETALSDSTLIRCMDGTVRDLAGLRGTYRLIDKTDEAIRLVGRQLENRNAGRAVFYLDAPVSNSGRLRARILELLEERSFATEVKLVPNADVILEKEELVATSDAIILNHCKSWINLASDVLEDQGRMQSHLIDLSGAAPGDGCRKIEGALLRS